MKGVDDGPDGLDDEEWERAWERAMVESAAKRAARLPSKVRQSIPIPVIPTPPSGGKP